VDIFRDGIFLNEGQNFCPGSYSKVVDGRLPSNRHRTSASWFTSLNQGAFCFSAPGAHQAGFANGSMSSAPSLRELFTRGCTV